MGGNGRGRRKVALFMGLSDTYEHGIARGVVRYAKQRSDWSLFGYGWMFRPLEALEYWDGDGIIARVESREDADRLAALDIPVVDVAGAYLGSGFLQVNNDDRATGTMAGEYLLARGFKRLAFCGVRGVGWSERRKQGFVAAVRGSSPQVPVFEESLAWWERLDRSEHLGEWLSALRCPAGVFACNDTAGLKLTELCRKLKLSVPQELAILGVDNEDILCELSFPTLSSIMLDCEAIGYRAAELLAGRMRRMPSAQTPVATILVPPKEVVERESSRVFTCDDPLVEQAVRYIRAHATEGSRVADVAAGLPASRRNLEVRFKRALGRTLHEEIVRTRLEAAKALLRTTDHTVARVAEESGFGTLQRFYEVFRKRESVSPARYRRLRRRTS
jgi:LacI family transcriptional regulator